MDFLTKNNEWRLIVKTRYGNECFLMYFDTREKLNEVAKAFANVFRSIQADGVALEIAQYSPPREEGYHNMRIVSQKEIMERAWGDL